MNLKKYLAEAVGTMFLVLLACGSAVLAGPSIGGYGIGVCFGLVLICLCYCIGNISGCHVNPAVSLGVFLSGRMNAKDFCCYVIAQLIGAAIGAGFLYWFTHMAMPLPAEAPEAYHFHFGGITKIWEDGKEVITGTIAANTVQPGVTQGMALLSEILLTFFFVLIVLGATDSEKGFGKFAGLAIGIGLGLVNIVGIPVDNCSVNPARSFGPALFSDGCGAWGDFWIMVVGPFVGAIIAVLCWNAVRGYVKGSVE